MGLHRMSPHRILLTGLLLTLVLPLLAKTAGTETEFYYWVTVNPTTPDLVIHSPVGRNWTISFQATWTYGNNSGQTIKNATISVEVRTTDSAVLETLLPKTNATGFISFYYSSPTPNVLMFAPTKLVTEDGMEWNQSLLDAAHLLYGFKSKPITIYWDSFDASLISTDTDSFGVARVSVNITYLLIPKEGLTVPHLSNNSYYDYIPKYVHDANVTINGVRAEESLPGVYTGEASTGLPTTYILIEVSQEGWLQTQQAFSFTHDANAFIWALAAIIGMVCAVVLLIYCFISSKKTKAHALFKEKKVPIIGAILLIITSFISMYWALVGIESALHGFDWMLLGIFGVIAFVFGLAGSIMSIRRKNFALTMVAVCFPLLENTVVVKYSFDNYLLAISWITIAPAFIISILSGVLIGRSDEEFS